MKNTSANRRYRQTARAESAAATGRRIVDAFLKQLDQQWYDEITLDCVAEDAGVTVQTVIRRFGGKAGLLAEAIGAIKLQVKEHRATEHANLEQLVKHLVDGYEATGDTVIRLLALEDRHSVLHEQLNLGRGWHRTWVQKAFAHELGKLRPKERESALDALVIATDVYTWKLLRRDMTRSVKATEATLKNMISSTMAAYLNGKDAR
jgi:AcrR family transcriptional regulator